MKVWDAELLTDKKELSPVTDGLAFWVDGTKGINGVPINTDTIAGSFTEIISGEQVSFNGFRSNDTDSMHVLCDGLFYTFERHYIYDPTFSISSSAYSAVNAKTVEATLQFTRDSFYDTVNVACIGRFWNGFSIRNPDSSLRVDRVDGGFFSRPRHIVATIDETNSQIKLYVNGTNVDTQTTSVTSFAPYTYFMNLPYIGRETSRYVKLGTVRLYTKPLNSDEIAQNFEYEKTIGRFVS